MEGAYLARSRGNPYVNTQHKFGFIYGEFELNPDKCDSGLLTNMKPDVVNSEYSRTVRFNLNDLESSNTRL